MIFASGLTAFILGGLFFGAADRDSHGLQVLSGVIGLAGMLMMYVSIVMVLVRCMP